MTSTNVLKGIAVFQNKLSGYVSFIQVSNEEVRVNGMIKGVKKGKHGIHIHESGDLREGCKSLCSHFNPYNKYHGGPDDTERHVGDLGNIEPSANGVVKITLYDNKIKLDGSFCNHKTF